MTGLKMINLAIRFLLELCLLVAVGHWGFKAGSGWLLKFLLGIGIPVLIAVIWGTFVSPKAVFRLHGMMLLGLEALLFGLAVAALYATQNYSLAWGFAVIVAINRVLMLIWSQ